MFHDMRVTDLGKLVDRSGMIWFGCSAGESYKQRKVDSIRRWKISISERKDIRTAWSTAFGLWKGWKGCHEIRRRSAWANAGKAGMPLMAGVTLYTVDPSLGLPVLFSIWSNKLFMNLITGLDKSLENMILTIGGLGTFCTWTVNKGTHSISGSTRLPYTVLIQVKSFWLSYHDQQTQDTTVNSLIPIIKRFLWISSLEIEFLDGS